MTKIEWVKNVDGSSGQTWNPITGCTKISPGCKNCYAETMAKRLKAMGKPQYQGVIGDNGKWNGRVEFVGSALEKPLKRRKPMTYFVNSMSDMFHENVTDIWLSIIWFTMTLCRQHTFQILTKRADIMAQKMPVLVDCYGLLPNVWLGVSVENQAAADERIPHLLQAPAAVKFLSLEPLLGPINLEDLAFEAAGPFWAGYNPLVDWVIVGGESGPNARSMHPDWVRSIRDQCQAANVPLFFKQWGEWLPTDQSHGPSGSFPSHSWSDEALFSLRVGKKQAGRLLDGQLWDQMPAVARGEVEA
jgi:protein gp37